MIHAHVYVKTGTTTEMLLTVFAKFPALPVPGCIVRVDFKEYRVNEVTLIDDAQYVVLHTESIY